VKAIAAFSAALIAVVGALTLLFGIAFRSALDHRAIYGAALVAVVVQLFSFGVARLTATSNYLAGWVMGILLRFVALVAFAFVAVKGMGLPAPAALLSLATFLFVSTLLESKFIAL
jgi:hypothetical protein